jgi:hypothetical protein
MATLVRYLTVRVIFVKGADNGFGLIGVQEPYRMSMDAVPANRVGKSTVCGH